MRAELVIDLPSLGNELAALTDRRAPVLPDLTALHAMFEQMGIHVDTMHVVAPRMNLRPFGTPCFGIEHVSVWWDVEKVLHDEATFDAFLVQASHDASGPVASVELAVVTALRRSDETDRDLVIVLGSDPALRVATTHARGAVVAIAGTEVDEDIAHLRLDEVWLCGTTERFEKPNVSARLDAATVLLNGDAISTDLTQPVGRDATVTTIPSMAGSVALFDPEWFGSEHTLPTEEGIARIVHTLNLGELVHVATPDADDDPLVVSTRLAAGLYRIATDHPELPIIVASSRSSLVLATSDPVTWGLTAPRRFLRLCLPQRPAQFDEHLFNATSPITRVVLERRLSGPLFEPESPIVSRDRGFTVIDGDRSEEAPGRSGSPSLVLYTNPNRVKAESSEWRADHDRRFLIVSADGQQGVPADDPEGSWLPLEVGHCDDFLARQPSLSPGVVVEAVLRDDREAWVVVSDPIERRRAVRSAEQAHAV